MAIVSMKRSSLHPLVRLVIDLILSVAFFVLIHHLARSLLKHTRLSMDVMLAVLALLAGLKR